ncbi:MAG: sigma-54-dependent Fis family transcriptional regulator [Ignavibacteriae bacterium]|jgi:DNA-binding NtrC family response regulator|nr:sigma-54-dependent Fis family transcriptional regulator [Ignavibacteriota bacterium]
MYINSKILLADDDETMCYLLKEELVNSGFQVDIVYDGKYAIDNLKKKNYDLVLLDLEMKEVNGDQVLEFIRETYPETISIILTGVNDIRTAVKCVKIGAFDYLTKPYEFDELELVIKKALDFRKLKVDNELLKRKIDTEKPTRIIGDSSSIKEVINLSLKASNSDSNILLQGETGTGKELFAEFIHKSSNRKDKPFVAINCASLPDQLIESELFGHEKGAFTDARNSKQGLVEIADGGTLFLDEIGELSLSLQPKLLRFLENGEFRRIGGINNLKSNVRVIGATNKDLMEEAEKKTFRRDLLFRLNVITLTIPPLRDRGKDKLVLAKYFLDKKSSVHHPKHLSSEAEKELLNYNFPGNVRELEHIIERSIIFSEGEEILPKDLSLTKEFTSLSEDTFATEEGILSMEDVEKVHIRKALVYYNWNRENTARALGVSQKTLYSKIKKYNLK